ncbi:hypothetical protein PIB30_080166 [Stylosanthes scabra]|uniref:Uncharacterized protein n=1 Tax=Stylosanthes scabra TaxID=79078 RepID=A0ABU6TU64_9FABA|nr:hypothetical protein [Stylosanthes scabra]
MAEELFYFVVHPNGVIVRRETGASFESSAPVMFRHNRVRTLVELKQLILSHLGPAGGLEISHLAYRFQPIIVDNRLEYRLSWISEDSHVWMTFEVHKRVMDGKFMEFSAEVRHVGNPAPSHVLALEDAAMRDYNSREDSDYEEDSSCHSTEQDEEVPNTPAGCPRLVLPPPLPIPDLAHVPCSFQQLNIDTRHVEDPSMEDVDVEYNTDGGVEFMGGGPKDRVAAHVPGPRHVGRSLSARQHVDHECRAAPGQDKSFSVGPFVAECCSTKLSFQTILQKSVDGEEEGDVTIVWRF